MQSASTAGNTVTVGLEVGDKHVHACFIDADGQIIEETRLAATTAGLRRRFGTTERYRVILGAGLHSPWMSRLLVELGQEVHVANPRRLRAIYLNENKSDRVDAEYLARIGRLDPALLFPLRHRSATVQADLALVRSRSALVKARATLVNYVRGWSSQPAVGCRTATRTISGARPEPYCLLSCSRR
jgi:transposase